jgi:prepilin-type processing-associated H-X9-DG protein/prepilin-type N-terminal cleavage/methylation domain-containing protein
MIRRVNRSIRPRPLASAFTLIEVLVVVGIVGLLISILLPALSSSRKQARSAHCLARLKDIGTSFATYAADNADKLPPNQVDWHPLQVRYMEDNLIDRCRLPIMFGWAELLYEHTTPNANTLDWSPFPAQRNYLGKYGESFACMEATERTSHAGHYRSYYISWSQSAIILDDERRLIGLHAGSTSLSPTFSSLQPHLVLIGDANEDSAAGDYQGGPAWPDPSCVNYEEEIVPEVSNFGVESVGGVIFNGIAREERDSNSMARRHNGAPNILFADLHAERSLATLRALACDWDQNGVNDNITETQAHLSACGEE